MSSQPGPFIWQQVDQTLANSMLSELSQEFGKLRQEDLQHIHYLNIGNGNAMTIPSERLEMHALRTEELAARYYSVYCEVWRCQQKPLSPEFLRAICPHILRGLLSARATGIESEFRMEQMRTHRPDPGWLKAAMGELRRSMDRLYSKWEKIAAFDAKSLEYMLAAAPDNPAVDSVAAQIVHARTQARIMEARLASIEARITISERALSATELRQGDAYRIKTIEQHLDGLRADKKQFELRRDQWQLNLNAALSRSAELRSQASNSLSDGDFHQVTGREEQPQGKPHQEQPNVNAEPNHVRAIGPEREITQARERVRHFEAEIAAIDTKIAAFQQSLTQAITNPSSFKPRGIDKAIRKLHADKKDLEFRRDDWELILNGALKRLAGERTQNVDLQADLPVISPKLLKNEHSALEGTNRKPHREVSPKLNYTSPVKRAIAWVLTTNPDSSDLEVCRRFDEDGIVDLPKYWTTGENRFFERAYKDPKHRRKIEILISRVRTDMRKKGLLS